MALPAAWLALAACGVSAQTAQPSSGAASAASAPAARARGPGRNDQQFVRKAARSGMAEVQLGRLGQERASNPRVKAFAERMVSDHGAANEELLALARKKGIDEMPKEIDGEHRRAAERMQRLNGVAFDRAFMRQMAEDHRKAVSEFERAAKRDDGDADIKAFAAAKLPTLQEHLRHAEGLRDGGIAASAPGAAASR